MVMVLGCPIQGDLKGKKLEPWFAQNITNLFDQPFCEVRIRWTIDLLHPVFLDKMGTDFSELLTHERLATRKIEVFYPP
jgi:hypothetical protein